MIVANLTRFDADGWVRLAMGETSCFAALCEAYGRRKYPERGVTASLSSSPFIAPNIGILVGPGEDERQLSEDIGRDLSTWAGEHLDAALAMPEPFDAAAFVAACMNEVETRTMDFLLDGKFITDVVRVLADGLEVCERHWSSNEIVREADGSPRTLILRGKVEPLKIDLYGASSSYLRQPYPCHSCGGSCPPGNCRFNEGV